MMYVVRDLSPRVYPSTYSISDFVGKSRTEKDYGVRRIFPLKSARSEVLIHETCVLPVSLEEC